MGDPWDFYNHKPDLLQFLFKRKIDFTDVKWPFGGGLIAFGILCILSSFRKKTIEAERKAKNGKSVLMCPKCIKPHIKCECPNCQTPLEQLSGFYERHPDLKDSEGK